MSAPRRARLVAARHAARLALTLGWIWVGCVWPGAALAQQALTAPPALAPPEVVVEGGEQVVQPPSEEAAPAPLHADPFLAGARTVITREAFRDTQKSVADVLEEVPGVTVTRSGDALAGTRVSIRGSRSDQVLILLDGVPLTGEADRPATRRAQGRAGLDLAALPLEQVESIEIVRGAASSLYGPGAAAGAILVRTRHAREPALSLAATGGSGGTAEADAVWTLPLGEGAQVRSLTLHLNHRRSEGRYVFYDAEGGAAPPQANPCAEPLGEGYYERGCNASRATTIEANWRGGPRRHVAALAERLERFGLGGIEDPRPYGLEQRRRLRLLYEDAAILGTEGAEPTESADAAAPVLSWQLSVERLHGERNENTTLPPDPAWVSAFTDTRGGGELRWERWLRRHRLEGGLALNGEWLRDGDLAAARTAASAFAAWDYHPAAGTWEVSLRRDDLTALAPRTTARGAFSHGLGGGFGVKGSLASGYRPPTLQELYDPGATGSGSVANPDLQPEDSRSADAGVYYTPGERFSAELLAFRQEARHQIVALPAPGSPNELRFENVSRTRSTGLEASIGLRPTAGLSLDAAWSAQRALILENDAVDPRDNGNLVPGVPERRWSLALAWRWADWHAWLQARHSGQRFVDTANTRYLLPYTVADGGVTTVLGAGWSLGIEGRNLGNATYAELDNYPPPGLQVLITLRWSRGEPTPAATKPEG